MAAAVVATATPMKNLLAAARVRGELREESAAQFEVAVKVFVDHTRRVSNAVGDWFTSRAFGCACCSARFILNGACSSPTQPRVVAVSTTHPRVPTNSKCTVVHLSQ
jgi:hypothetical protein